MAETNAPQSEEEFLAMFAQAGSAAEFIRKSFAAGDDERDKGLTSPEDVRRFDDIAYGPDPVWQVLDVYRPKKAEGRILPVIVSVHGGGWVYGDKERYQFYCMNLAQRGFAVVNFTYRLAPEFKYPAGMEDTNLVFRWVLNNADKYGFDAGHIFAAGDSAGAHILALYCAICTNKEYAAEYDFSIPQDFAPMAIALNCGAYKIKESLMDTMTLSIMKDMLPEGGTEEEYEMISPSLHITGDFPPVFYMTCTGDFLKEDAPLLGAALLENDVPHIFRYYGDKNKQLGHVFHLNIRSADAKKCNDDECAFFKTFL